MLNKLKSSFLEQKYFWIFLFLYLIFRIFILNTNSAEWGDSYRILRATEYLQTFTYPEDEKRPPLFSVLLLIKLHEDPVLAGRIVMIFISLVNLFLLYSLSSKLISYLNLKSKIYRHIPLIVTILFSLSPLYLYWALRIYADNLFLTFMLLSFGLYFNFLDSQKSFHKFFYMTLVSLVTVLAILTRFEGYLLFGSLLLSLFISVLIYKNSKDLKYFLFFGLITFGLIFFVSYFDKYTFYENPLVSKYVDEVESRKLTVREVGNYVFQLIYLSGSIFGMIFLYFGAGSFLSKKFLPIYVFIFLQLALSFIWYAAVPRLFLPVLPFYLFLVVLGVYVFYEKTRSQKISNISKRIVILSFLLLLAYFSSQYILKVPFLITGFRLLAVNLGVGLIGIVIFLIYFYKTKSIKMIFAHLFISSVVWTYLFISLEKDTYKVLNQGIMYFLKNYPKNSIVMTNDVSSISRFYLKDNFRYSRELDLNRNIEEKVSKVRPDFIIVTNEHNPQMSFTPSKIPNLVLEKEFREVVNTRTFFTQIIRVKP